jgi:hypothetical protein
MANQETISKVRQLTVCNKHFRRAGNYPHSRYVTFPVICFTGKWLAESGFRAGHVIDITCEEGRLTITLSREQRFEHI